MMPLKRFGLAVFLAGCVVKAALVAVWKFGEVPLVGQILTFYDPGAFYLARTATAMAFDQRRLFPGASEASLFVAVLIVGFGLECLVLGLVVRWFLLRRSLGGVSRLGSSLNHG